MSRLWLSSAGPGNPDATGSFSGEAEPKSKMMRASPLQLPPIWRETRFGLEAAALFRSRVFRGIDVEDAGGQPVMLIPGFLAGDDSLGLMTTWLRRTGHWTKSAGIRSNVDCSSAIVERLGGRLDCLAEASGERGAVIGEGRGGEPREVLPGRVPGRRGGRWTL